MNTEHASVRKAPVQWRLWGISLMASMAVGWYAGRAFISASIWRDTGRACPEGWLGVAIGLGLVAAGILLRRRWRAYATAFLCGIGSGFVVWPAFLVLYSKIAPSC